MACSFEVFSNQKRQVIYLTKHKTLARAMTSLLVDGILTCAANLARLPLLLLMDEGMRSCDTVAPFDFF